MIELLVVIAIIAILAGLLLPGLAKAKQKTQGIQCMNNHRQLTLAWLMYAHDNDDWFSDSNNWIWDPLDFAPGNPYNWDASISLYQSPLWDYCGKSAAIFRCPADKSTVRPSSGPFRGQTVPRVRSMSMALWFGGFWGMMPTEFGQGLASPPWQMYRRLSDLRDPGPTLTALFWDQREDSINWGNFAIDMSGYPDHPEQTKFVQDMPGSYHHRAGGLSFADGHAEIRRWRDERTMPPLRHNSNWIAGANVVRSPNNRDIIWLQERTTRRLTAR